MCGINGIISKNKVSKDFLHSELLVMNAALKHRGPNASGTWISDDGQVSFGHTRLSIIDLSQHGAQPMTSENNSFVMSFNGEIYNHKKIRDMLSKRYLIKWNGTSDTETLINAFQCLGIEETLKTIEGMFALALFNKETRRIYLTRDRFGEKPLYYGFVNKNFVFASEIKALNRLNNFDSTLNYRIIPEFLARGFIPAPHTIFKNLYKIMPGQVLEIDLKATDTPFSQHFWEYWSAKECAKINKGKQYMEYDEAKHCIKNSLQTSIQNQQISDVPIGTFLSGGIDSSLVTAIMQSESMTNVSSFSIGFSESRFDESSYAKSISDFLGTSHYEHVVTSKEALSIIPNIFEIYDEPFGDSSQIPTYILSRFAKQDVTVVLSGDGGDELFGGYNRHIFTHNHGKKLFLLPYFMRKNLARILTLIRPTFLETLENKINNHGPRTNNLSNLISKISLALSSKDYADLYQNLISAKKFSCGASLAIPFDNSYFSNEETMMLNDQIDYLPNDILTKVDRASMAVSLETRVPFLALNVFENSWKTKIDYKIRDTQGKFILRDILSDYVPKELFNRPKQGFALPIDLWLRGDLNSWAKEIIYSADNGLDKVLDINLVKEMFKSHSQNDANFHTELWNVLMLLSWLEHNKISC